MPSLNLDAELIDSARASASDIADDLDRFIRKRTTSSVERTVLRLYGVNGADDNDVPLPNVVVEEAKEIERLGEGITRLVAELMLETGLEPSEIAEEMADGELKFLKPGKSEHAEAAIQSAGEQLAADAISEIEQQVEQRESFLQTHGRPERPMKYVIVATGNIHEDVVQAKSAARQGADVVAVIRSTAQSLLDYVPEGLTTVGDGGTFATQANFRLMREALDEVGEEEGRYIRLCNYCSGLCMPEIAALGAIERLDMMLNDALYGILFRDINPKRTFVDQYFSRMVNALAGVIINTGEDNYLTTADPVEAADTVLASQFINEQLAYRSGLPADQMGLGHAMEMDPDRENGFLLELAQALMSRQIFPKAPLKYMPPTKHMTGNIFKGHIQDALFNLVGVWSGQAIQLLGMMTEAMHTPHMSDRYLALENAEMVMSNARDIGDEIEFKENGIVQTRASNVLGQAEELLEKIEDKGLFEALEEGIFADIGRGREKGKGADGVIRKEDNYFNPLESQMREKLGL